MKSKFDFYGQIQESDGTFVILIPSSLSGVARGYKDKQIKVSIEL